MMQTSTLLNMHEGVQRVSQRLLELGHDQPPRWLDEAAHTAQAAADLLGVALGQIAKSIIFKQQGHEASVLVIASGDRRVNEELVAALVGPIERAKAAFVKEHTGFSIGGVSPLAHVRPGLVLMDPDLFRFDTVWAAAGHPNAIFSASPQQLQTWTQARTLS